MFRINVETTRASLKGPLKGAAQGHWRVVEGEAPLGAGLTLTHNSCAGIQSGALWDSPVIGSLSAQPCDLRVMSWTGSFSGNAASIVTYRFGRSLETQFMINMLNMLNMMIKFLGPN